MRVLLDTTPLTNGNSGRGVGTYTRELLSALRSVKSAEPVVIQATHELGTQVLDPAKHFEVVHYPYFDLFFETLPKLKGVARIVTVHDVIPLVFPSAYPSGIRGGLRFLKQKFRLKSVDAIITDSMCSKRDIVKHLGINEHRVHVVPLAASPLLQPQTEYYQEKYTQELELPEKYIVYVGDINYNKNLPTLLLALTGLPDVHLVVVSRTFRNTAIPEGKRLAEIIRENDLEERVHVLDVPSDKPEVLSAVISQARALVQPSLYEGFGLPVLEAMQVGAVVVSSNGGSLPEVAGEAAIMVEPTIIGLQEGIQEAWSLRGEERQKRVQAGLDQAAKFSWQKTAQQTLAVYEHVLQERA